MNENILLHQVNRVQSSCNSTY